MGRTKVTLAAAAAPSSAVLCSGKMDFTCSGNALFLQRVRRTHIKATSTLKCQKFSLCSEFICHKTEPAQHTQREKQSKKTSFSSKKWFYFYWWKFFHVRTHKYPKNMQSTLDTHTSGWILVYFMFMLFCCLFSNVEFLVILLQLDSSIFGHSLASQCQPNNVSFVLSFQPTENKPGVATFVDEKHILINKRSLHLHGDMVTKINVSLNRCRKGENYTKERFFLLWKKKDWKFIKWATKQLLYVSSQAQRNGIGLWN